PRALAVHRAVPGAAVGELGARRARPGRAVGGYAGGRPGTPRAPGGAPDRVAALRLRPRPGHPAGRARPGRHRARGPAPAAASHRAPVPAAQRRRPHSGPGTGGPADLTLHRLALAAGRTWPPSRQPLVTLRAPAARLGSPSDVRVDGLPAGGRRNAGVLVNRRRPFDPRLLRRIPEVRRHLTMLGGLAVVAAALIITQATALATVLATAADKRLHVGALAVFVGAVAARALVVWAQGAVAAAAAAT